MWNIPLNQGAVPCVHTNPPIPTLTPTQQSTTTPTPACARTAHLHTRFLTFCPHSHTPLVHARTHPQIPLTETWTHAYPKYRMTGHQRQGTKHHIGRRCRAAPSRMKGIHRLGLIPGHEPTLVCSARQVYSARRLCSASLTCRAWLVCATSLLCSASLTCIARLICRASLMCTARLVYACL